MNETERLLEELRDIHEPAVPQGLPLWLPAANLMVVLLVLAAVFFRRRRMRESWRKQALRQIAQARTLEPQAGLLLLAGTLRQIMLLRTGNDPATDKSTWLEQLDDAFDTNWFTQSAGQMFGPALYSRAATSTDTHKLCSHLETLVRSLPALE